MAFNDLFVTQKTAPVVNRTTSFSSLFANLSEEEVARKKKIQQYNVETEQLKEESKKLNSLGGLVRGTASELYKVPKNFVKNTYETYKQTPTKIIEDVQSGAKDIQEGKVLKGTAKTGLRVAGDIAITLFAPISSAIGAVLEASGGQKLVDKGGQVIADKSGITNVPAFQKFAMEHPNAGEDFDRLLNLALLGKMGNEKISPKSLADATKVFVDKVTTQAKVVNLKPVKPTPPPTQGFNSVFQEPVKIGLPKAIETGETKPSRLGTDLEARTLANKIEADFGILPEYKTMNMEAQARGALDLVTSDIERAKRILNLEEAPPGDLKLGSIYGAMEDAVIRQADASSVLELSKSKIPEIASAYGQEVKAFDVLRSENSPVQAIRDIRQAKIQNVEKNQGIKIQSKIKEEKAKYKEPKIEDNTWSEFISSLEC